MFLPKGAAAATTDQVTSRSRTQVMKSIKPSDLSLVLGVALVLLQLPLLLAPLVVRPLPLDDLVPVPLVLLPPLPQDVLARLVVVLPRLGLKEVGIHPPNSNSRRQFIVWARRSHHWVWWW